MDNSGPTNLKCEEEDGDGEINLDCDMTDSSIELDELRSKALGIYVVFAKIMAHLPYDEVQWNCALVNRAWNSSATSYLQKWTILKILIRDWGNLQLPVGLTERVGLESEEKPRRIRWISVQQLEEKLQPTSKKTKKIRLLLRYLGQENETEVIRKCITLVSPWVTKLTIHDTRNLIFDGTVPMGRLHDDPPTFYVEGDTMPNLVHLCMGKFGLKHENRGPKIPFLHPDTLNRIEIVEFNSDYSCSYNYTVSLLEATPNVEKIVNFTLADSTQSSHASMRNNMALLQKFGSKFYKLTHLALGAVRDWPESCQVFSQILEANQDCLEKMEIWPLFSSDLIRIPPLIKLTTLALLDNGRQEGNYFSGDLDLATAFPSLITLEICTLSANLTYVKELWPQDFWQRQASKLVCLKKLSLRNEGKPVLPIFKYFASIFSQIEILVVETDAYVFSVPFFPNLWERWSNLRELTVKIDWCKSRHGQQQQQQQNFNFCLDSSVTGIHQNSCCRLLSTGNFDQLEDLDTIKTGKGISDMKNLSKFSLAIYWNDRIDGRSAGWVEPYTIFSRLSALYGFQKVPGLVVKILNYIPSNYVQRKQQIVDIWNDITPFADVEYIKTRD